MDNAFAPCDAAAAEARDRGLPDIPDIPDGATEDAVEIPFRENALAPKATAAFRLLESVMPDLAWISFESITANANSGGDVVALLPPTPHDWSGRPIRDLSPAARAALYDVSASNPFEDPARDSCLSEDAGFVIVSAHGALAGPGYAFHDAGFLDAITALPNRTETAHQTLRAARDAEMILKPLRVLHPDASFARRAPRTEGRTRAAA